MIMRGTTPRRLSWCGLLAVAGTAALLLPLMPTFAQSPPPASGQPQTDPRPEGGGGEQAKQARAEVDRSRAELELARSRLADAEARLRDRVAQVQTRDEERRAGRRGGRMVIIIQDENGREIRRMEVQPGQQIRVPGGDGGPGGGRGPEHQPPGAVGRPGGPGGADLPMLPGSAHQPGRPANRAGEAGSDQERRLQNLERRLDEVMRLLEQMRRERNPGAEPRLDRRPGAGRRNGPEEEEDPNIKPLDRKPAEPGNRRRGQAPPAAPSP